MSKTTESEVKYFLNQVLIGTPEDGEYSKFFFNKCLFSYNEKRDRYEYKNPFLGMFSKIQGVFMAKGDKQVWKYVNDTSYDWSHAGKDYDWGWMTYEYMMDNKLHEKFWTERERVHPDSYRPNWRDDMQYLINYSFYIKREHWDDFMDDVFVPVFMKIFVKA